MTTFSLFFVVAFFLLPPQLSAASLEYELNEELPVGTVVGNIKQDFSMRSNYSEATLSSLRYRFQSPNEHLRLDNTTGVIRIGSTIDRDVICRFEERCVINCDVIVEPIEFYVIVAVAYVIVDVNDNSPQFQTDRFRLEVSEATPVQTLFLLPSAEDPDGEQFGVRTCTMNGDQDTFDLIFVEHEDALRLQLKKPLDRERVALYSMRIVAADGGSPPRTANLDLEIVVKDDNDNAPRLVNENYEATVEENLPVGRKILQVKADDPDEGRNGYLTYSLSDDSAESYGDVFGINQDGWIHVTGVIDYERYRSLVLAIIVSDQGVMPLTSYAGVVIYVSDVNDNDPVIKVSDFHDRRAAEVHENKPSHTLVAHIVVTDADGGDNGKVTCVIDNHRFRLETVSQGHSEYKLFSADIFDREERSHEGLVMSCRDRGQPPRSSSLAISVWIIDENDNTPKFLQDTITVRLRENNRLGTQIAVFNATDLDEGKNAELEFSIEADESSFQGAVFVDSKGVVSANMVFDHEKRQEYLFRVVARDRGEPSRSSHARLEIQIEDVNDESPTFEVDWYIFRARENVPPGTPVGSVRAFDRDRSLNFTNIYYSFVEDQIYLSINPVSGEIIIRKAIDRENQAIVEVKVRASNDPDFLSTGTNQSEVNVRLYVEDENDNSPVITFPNSLNNSLTLRNEVKVRDRVGRIEAFDLDEGVNANLTFFMDETSEAAKFFGVEVSTGWIVIADGYEKEAFSELGGVQLVVRVTDQGRPPRSSTETLVVLAKGTEEIAVELHSDDFFGSSSMLIAVGVGLGTLAIALVLTVSLICFRIRRFKVKNSHSYNCRLEAKKATSSCNLNTYTPAHHVGSKTQPPLSGESRCKEVRGTGKKGVRFNLDQENGPYIGSPITDCKLSCPFPDECAFHRHDITDSKNSSPSSFILNEPLHTHEPLARYQRQIQQQPMVVSHFPQRTLRKVDIPTIDQILSNRNNSRQAGSGWTTSTGSYPDGGRPLSAPEQWSNGSVPDSDSGQGPSDGEESGVFYPGSQEPFFPMESRA